MRQKLTLITGQGSKVIDAITTATEVMVSSKTFADETGWTLKPEGFCFEDICIPARDAVDADGNVDLSAFAKLTDRPFIIDVDNSAASMGATFSSRGENLNSLQAPEFSLPDLTGEMHALSDYRGKKVLLAAYASW
jgi:hypothetical protein